MSEITVENVINILNANIESIEITEDKLYDNLLEYGMDSISFIQIVIALEEAFDCQIPDQKLLITEMDSVKKIMDVLQTVYDDRDE